MPWKNKTTMEQKVEFICEWLTQKYTITQLCNEFGISRPTAYKMIHRYESSGIDGLKEIGRSPKNHPNQTSEKIEHQIIKLKEKYPRWGAKKIRVLLFKNCSEKDIPSVVTVHNILSRNGFVKPQKRVKRVI